VKSVLITNTNLAQLELLALRRLDVTDRGLVLDSAVCSLPEDTNLVATDNEGVALVACCEVTILLAFA
jgi:hypothetical protein